VIAHNNQFVKNETKQKYSKNWPYDVKDGLKKPRLGQIKQRHGKTTVNHKFK